MKFSKIILSAVAAAILAGCGSGGGQVGSEYVGKWQNIKDEKVSEVIERNGDQFFVSETAPSLTHAHTQTTSRAAATIDKNGVLVISTVLGNVNFTIDKTTGNLTGHGTEYKKVN